MGSGKTTLGRNLAERLGFDFFDSDAIIQERTGVDIPTIFEFEGEAGFRKREKEIIDELTQKKRIILATGGGVILDPDNRHNLSSRGFVIYLYCSVDHQFERTARDRNRPLLRTSNPKARLQDLMQQREPLYREVADFVLPTEGRSVHSSLQQIIDYLDAPK